MTRAGRWLAGVGVAVLLLGAREVGGEATPYWEGRPRYEPGESTGYFVWKDESGWHVRWTAKAGRPRFSGRISSDGFLADYKAVGQDWRGLITQANEGTITFVAFYAPSRDGIDFRLSESAGTVAFDLAIDGERTPANRVRLGAGGRHPARVPFTIGLAP
jgi:hypothetical protein